MDRTKANETNGCFDCAPGVCHTGVIFIATFRFPLQNITHARTHEHTTLPISIVCPHFPSHWPSGESCLLHNSSPWVVGLGVSRFLSHDRLDGVLHVHPDEVEQGGGKADQYENSTQLYVAEDFNDLHQSGPALEEIRRKPTR